MSTFEEKRAQWEGLLDTVGKRLEEFPHLAKDHAALEPLLTRARELEGEQDLRKAELRDINLQRRQVEKQARALRNRLAASLRGFFGSDSVRLLEFGLQPRLEPIRRRNLSAATKAELFARKAAQATALAKAEALAREAAEAKQQAVVALPTTA